MSICTISLKTLKIVDVYCLKTSLSQIVKPRIPISLNLDSKSQGFVINLKSQETKLSQT